MGTVGNPFRALRLPLTNGISSTAMAGSLSTPYLTLLCIVLRILRHLQPRTMRFAFGEEVPLLYECGCAQVLACAG